MLQWLPWQDAAAATAVTAGAVGVTRRRTSPWAVRLRPWARELTLVLLLYALWQYAGAWSHGQTGAARARGAWIWRTERALHLPSEQSVQALVLPHTGVVRGLNEFYAQAHAPGLGLLLVWLFLRHRDRYPQVRTVIVLVTGACLAIQLWPVAPPRLLPGLGLVDTGAVIGPSDYTGGSPGVDQLSAMPSVHVAWALIVGGAIVWASTSRWRWLAAAYPVLTTFAVVATANHYWADGLAAAGLCLLAVAAVALAARSHPRLYVARRALAPALAPTARSGGTGERKLRHRGVTFQTDDELPSTSRPGRRRHLGDRPVRVPVASGPEKGHDRYHRAWRTAQPGGDTRSFRDQATTGSPERAN